MANATCRDRKGNRKSWKRNKRQNELTIMQFQGSKYKRKVRNGQGGLGLKSSENDK